MKIQIMRMSTLPVELEALEAYKAEWTVGFDAAKAKHGNDMLSLQADLQALETELLSRYSATGQVDLPKTAKAWKALMASFDAPIMIARSSEGKNEMVLVIVDTQIGG